MSQENVSAAIPKSNFLPAKPHISLYDSADATIESAMPALARQHAAKLAGVESMSTFTSGQAAMTSSPALSVPRETSLPLHPASLPPVSMTLGTANQSSTASFSATTQLATIGVGVGPGINPNISNPSSNSNLQGSTTTQNNPPIINTGNNGPMYVQPGDWVCSTCGFVNWRRRRVCMRCYPFADSNEMSKSIASGALLAAQLAAGYNPPPEIVASLTQPRRNTVSAAQSAAFAYDTQNAMSTRNYGQYMLAAQHGPACPPISMASYAGIPATSHGQGHDPNGATDAMLARLAENRLTVASTMQYPSNVAPPHHSALDSSFQAPLRSSDAFGSAKCAKKYSGGSESSTDRTSMDAQRWMEETMSQIRGTAIPPVHRPSLSRLGSGTSDFNTSAITSSSPSLSSTPRAMEWGAQSLSSLAQHANAVPFKSSLSSSSAPFQITADRKTATTAAVTQLHTFELQTRNSHSVASLSSSPARSPTISHLLSASATEFTTTATAPSGNTHYISATDEQDEIVQPGWTGARRRGHIATRVPASSEALATSSQPDASETAVLVSDKNRQAAIQPPGSRDDGGSSTTSLSSWNSSSKSSSTSLFE